MPTYQSNQLLEKLQQQTETLLNKAIREWQMIPPPKFSQQPDGNSWSAKQCIVHLNIYGDYYLPAIEGAILKAKNKKSVSAKEFKPGLFGNYFTHIMLPDIDGKPAKKMKAMKGYISSNNEDSDKVIATFIDQQEKLLQLLEDAKSINLNNTKVAISIAKFLKIKLGDVFMFLIAHNYRHVLQAERALKTAGITVNENHIAEISFA
ncbi:MAG TPA: DinB family protein, partial [Panacibacter sp.]|nr:DinB family protein [Panacibacter sp.]